MDAFERAYHREKAARKQAEDELETLSREIYQKNEELSQLNADLLRNQAQLVQSEKLATVSQLASGVAHEINNPLGFSLSNLSTLKDYVAELTKLIADGHRPIPDQTKLMLEDLPVLIEETVDGLHSIQSIIKDLRNYSRDAGDQFTQTDVEACIRSTLNMLRNQITSEFDIKVTLDNLPLIDANPGKLNQVFSNLIINAIQAMPAGGEITIDGEFDAGELIVRIADTGPRIPDEILGTLFEPFHTTKPVGEGTGFGLSICRAIIVEHHGGSIEARPIDQGTGTVFEMSLPTYRATDSTVSNQSII